MHCVASKDQMYLGHLLAGKFLKGLASDYCYHKQQAIRVAGTRWQMKHQYGLLC